MTMLRMLAFAGVDAGSKRAVNSVGHIAGNEVANKVVNKAANNVANHAAGNPPHMAVPQVAPNMGHGAAHNAAHSAAAPNAGTYGPTAQAVGVTKQRAASSPEQPASTHTLPDTYDVSGADGPDAAFDGNWPDFIARLNLSGMAGMLGKQCEFQSLVNGVLELVLPGAQKHLADKNYQEKLRSELAPHLGKNLRLNIRIGEASGVSLAAHEDRVRSERQANAVAAIAQDPFIQHLKQDFGAEVLSDSIRPANAQ
jgi:DNA polymerase-3 subunit gamma/tau